MKTVITYGVFDLFHEGHMRLLERAKALGDRLVVGITTDQYAIERGKLCVVDPLDTRIKNVLSCPCVDAVIVEDHPGQKLEDIQRLHADILAMGDDWFGKFDVLKSFCQVVYLPRTPNVSSSLLRSNRYPFQRSRPPRRRPRYPSLDPLSSMQAPYPSLPRKRESSLAPLHLLFRQNLPVLPEITIPAGFPRAISSLGAGIQLSARVAISEREYPASNRPCL